MASCTNAFENSWNLLVFNNTNIANIGDATGLRGSSSAGSLYLSLHTADPGEAGDQTTSEVAYGSYARQAVARSSSGFTVSGDTASLASAVNFPAPTSGSGSITHVGIGTAASGAGSLLLHFALTSPISFTSGGPAPQLTTGTQVVTA